MLMDIDLLTAFFLVFAGMLVGYVLFFRDRTQDVTERRNLTRENDELRSSLNAVNGSYETLEDKFSRQRGQLNVLQQLCDDWSGSRESAERERLQLESEVGDRKKKVEETEAELRKEKKLRIEAEDKLHTQTQESLKKVTTLEDTWKKKHSKADSRVIQLAAELKAAQLSGSQYTETSQKYKELDKQYALLQQETASLREKLTDIDSYEQQIESLKQSLANSEQQLTKVSEQRDAALAAEKSTASISNGLQSRIDNQESTIHMLRQNQDDALENLKHELNSRAEMESKLDSRVKELRDQFAEQRADYEKQIESFREQIEKQSSQYASHSKDLREQLSLRKTELEQEKLRWTTQSDSLTLQYREKKSDLSKQLKSLRAKADDYSLSIVKLSAQRDQLEADLKQTRHEMHGQLKQDSETIGKLQLEREELREELDKLRTQLAESQEKANSYQLDSARLTEEAEQLAAMRLRVIELESKLAGYDSKTKRLLAESAELARLRDDYAVATTRQQQLQNQLDDIRSHQSQDQTSREQFDAQLEDYEQRLTRTQARLDASEETIRNLRRERAGVLARLANYRQIADPETTVISFTHAIEQQNNSKYETEYGGRVRHDEVRGVVFTERPEKRDDLKRISGIAEVLEERLNDFGIFTFKQVMEWKPEAIEEFSRLLAFRDRIERDDWQGQARFFYNQKYKQPVSAAA